MAMVSFRARGNAWSIDAAGKQLPELPQQSQAFSPYAALAHPLMQMARSKIRLCREFHDLSALAKIHKQGAGW